MRVVLAEKPSVARELASFLRATTRNDGYFEGQGYQVTWVLGHLATLKEPEDYDPALKRWSLEALPIVPERFGLKLVEERGARKHGPRANLGKLRGPCAGSRGLLHLWVGACSPGRTTFGREAGPPFSRGAARGGQIGER